jgi:hypothetical protein
MLMPWNLPLPGISCPSTTKLMHGSFRLNRDWTMGDVRKCKRTWNRWKLATSELHVENSLKKSFRSKADDLRGKMSFENHQQDTLFSKLVKTLISHICPLITRNDSWWMEELLNCFKNRASIAQICFCGQLPDSRII